ncbi:MAG TPA: DUF6263 family protein [Gemmatimonadaceae bacterium]|nr:DUF6263 family protein [Gemmatimonadaceae bacterium]
MGFSVRRAVAGAALAVLPAPLAAQPVLLQIRPQIGDTIPMHLSQTVEMTGTTPGSDDPSQSMTTSIDIYTRAIPRQWTSSGTLLQTITDSVTMNPSSARSLADFRRRALQSRNAMIRVSIDGAVEVMDNADAAGELRHLFGEMPAMLPRTGVAVGGKWTREMRIPLSGEPGGTGSVRATFQLDSLSRTGDVAFISMKGSLSRNALPPAVQPGAGYETSGTLTGTIQLDRRVGWIVDSRSTIQVRSTVAALAGQKGEARRGPMIVRTRITQWLRAMRTR